MGILLTDSIQNIADHMGKLNICTCGLIIKGIHFGLNPNNLLEQLGILLECLREFNPVFSIEFGEDDVFVDICRKEAGKR